MQKRAEGGFPPTRMYSKYIERYPLVETGVLGGLGTVGGYMGSKWLTPKLLDVLMVGKSDEEKQQVLQELEQEGTMALINQLAAVAGGTAGAGYALNKHLDLGEGLSGVAGSMTDPNYYSRPEVAARVQKSLEDKKKLYRSTHPGLTTPYSSGRGMKQWKTGGLEDSLLFYQDRVPVAASVDLVNADPFLTLPQKDVTTTVLEGAGDGSSGLTSGKSLMRSALQLGVGAGTGYLFGRAASSLLSLPPVVTKRLSGAGALAGALINSGLFSEIEL